MVNALRRNPGLTVAAVVAAVAALVWVYGSFDPSVGRWFPRCTVKMLTGLDCPGCGSQRAIHSLLTGHPLDAWRYNAAFVISLPVIAMVGATRLWPRLWPRLTRFLGSRPFILAIFYLLVIWTILRNLNFASF